MGRRILVIFDVVTPLRIKIFWMFWALTAWISITGQQTFFKGRDSKYFRLWVLWSPWQLLHLAVTLWKPPQATCKQKIRLYSKNFYLQNWLVGQIWFTGHRLLTPDPHIWGDYIWIFSNVWKITSNSKWTIDGTSFQAKFQTKVVGFISCQV